MEKFIQIFASLMGVIMSLAYFPQAYKIYKNKSAEDISIFSFVIFSLGTLTWFVYGFVFKDIPIVIGFFFGVIGSFLVLILSIIYKNQ